MPMKKVNIEDLTGYIIKNPDLESPTFYVVLDSNARRLTVREVGKPSNTAFKPISLTELVGSNRPSIVHCRVPRVGDIVKINDSPSTVVDVDVEAEKIGVKILTSTQEEFVFNILEYSARASDLDRYKYEQVSDQESIRTVSDGENSSSELSDTDFPSDLTNLVEATPLQDLVAFTAPKEEALLLASYIASLVAPDAVDALGVQVLRDLAKHECTAKPAGVFSAAVAEAVVFDDKENLTSLLHLGLQRWLEHFSLHNAEILPQIQKDQGLMEPSQALALVRAGLGVGSNPSFLEFHVEQEALIQEIADDHVSPELPDGVPEPSSQELADDIEAEFADWEFNLHEGRRREKGNAQKRKAKKGTKAKVLPRRDEVDIDQLVQELADEQQVKDAKSASGSRRGAKRLKKLRQQRREAAAKVSVSLSEECSETSSASDEEVSEQEQGGAEEGETSQESENCGSAYSLASEGTGNSASFDARAASTGVSEDGEEVLVRPEDASFLTSTQSNQGRIYASVAQALEAAGRSADMAVVEPFFRTRHSDLAVMEFLREPTSLWSAIEEAMKSARSSPVETENREMQWSEVTRALRQKLLAVGFSSMVATGLAKEVSASVQSRAVSPESAFQQCKAILESDAEHIGINIAEFTSGRSLMGSWCRGSLPGADVNSGSQLQSFSELGGLHTSYGVLPATAEASQQLNTSIERWFPELRWVSGVLGRCTDEEEAIQGLLIFANTVGISVHPDEGSDHLRLPSQVEVFCLQLMVIVAPQQLIGKPQATLLPLRDGSGGVQHLAQAMKDVLEEYAEALMTRAVEWPFVSFERFAMDTAETESDSAWPFLTHFFRGQLPGTGVLGEEAADYFENTGRGIPQAVSCAKAPFMEAAFQNALRDDLAALHIPDRICHGAGWTTAAVGKELVTAQVALATAEAQASDAFEKEPLIAPRLPVFVEKPYDVRGVISWPILQMLCGVPTPGTFWGCPRLTALFNRVPGALVAHIWRRILLNFQHHPKVGRMPELVKAQAADRGGGSESEMFRAGEVFLGALYHRLNLPTFEHGLAPAEPGMDEPVRLLEEVVADLPQLIHSGPVPVVRQPCFPLAINSVNFWPTEPPVVSPPTSPPGHTSPMTVAEESSPLPVSPTQAEPLETAGGGIEEASLVTPQHVIAQVVAEGKAPRGWPYVDRLLHYREHSQESDMCALEAAAEEGQQAVGAPKGHAQKVLQTSSMMAKVTATELMLGSLSKEAGLKVDSCRPSGPGVTAIRRCVQELVRQQRARIDAYRGVAKELHSNNATAAEAAIAVAGKALDDAEDGANAVELALAQQHARNALESQAGSGQIARFANNNPARRAAFAVHAFRQPSVASHQEELPSGRSTEQSAKRAAESVQQQLHQLRGEANPRPFMDIGNRYSASGRHLHGELARGAALPTAPSNLTLKSATRKPSRQPGGRPAWDDILQENTERSFPPSSKPTEASELRYALNEADDEDMGCPEFFPPGARTTKKEPEIIDIEDLHYGPHGGRADFYPSDKGTITDLADSYDTHSLSGPCYVENPTRNGAPWSGVAAWYETPQAVRCFERLSHTEPKRMPETIVAERMPRQLKQYLLGTSEIAGGKATGVESILPASLLPSSLPSLSLALSSTRLP